MSMSAVRTLAGTVVEETVGGRGPVLLLHGIGSRARGWQAMVQRLNDVHCLAWDAPGYGESIPLAAGEPEAADYAARALAVLDEAEIERAHVVGHSLGALVAAALAREAPHRVSSLFLADPAMGYRNQPASERAAMISERVERLKQLGAADHAAKRSPRLLSDYAGPAARETVRNAMASLTETGYAAAVAMLASGQLEDDLHDWNGPLAFVSGELDSITPPEPAAALARRLDAPFTLIERAGHACYVEQPERFAQLLGNHLIQLEG